MEHGLVGKDERNRLELAQGFHASISNRGSSQFHLHDKCRKPLEFFKLRVVEATSDGRWCEG